MAAPIEFNIKILGGAAPELAKVGDGFDKVDSHARKAAGGVSTFDAEVGHLSTSVGGLTVNLSALAKGGSIFTFDLAEGITKVVELAGEAIEKFAEWGSEIVKVAGGAQDLELALRLTAGDRGTVDIEEIVAGLKATRLDDDEIKRDLLPFLEAGTRDKGLLFDLETAANDIAARRADPAARGAALAAFQKISLKGEVDARALRELAIGEADYFNALGGILGTSAERAKQLSSKGKVSSQTLLNVALQQIANREGGALGIASEQEGATLGASLKRLSDLKENLFKSVADSPGLKSAQTAIDKFVEFASGPVGQGLIDRIAGDMGKLAERALAFLGTEEGQARIEQIIVRTAGAIETVAGWVGTVADVLATLAPAWEVAFAPLVFIEGYVIRAGLAIWEFVGKTVELVGGFLGDVLDGNIRGAGARLYDAAVNVGEAIWQGLRDGITAGIDTVTDTIGGVADRAKKALGIASPSRVFMEIGGYTAEGFRLGMEEREGDIDATATRIFSRTVVGAAQAPAALPGAAPAQGGRDLPDINIVIQGAAQPVETAVAVRVALRQLFVEMGIGMGVPA